MKNDVVTTLHQLPSRFGACKAAADHMNLIFTHMLELAPLAAGFNVYYELEQRHLHHKVSATVSREASGCGILVRMQRKMRAIMKSRTNSLLSNPLSVLAVLSSGAIAGCSGTLSDGGTVNAAAYGAPEKVLTVCSGYGCIIKDKLTFAENVPAELEQIMEPGRESAEAERAALKIAIAYMESAAKKSLRFSTTDVEFSYQRHSGKRGQMDCVDESLNTITYLKYLHAKGLLRHHTPLKRFAERGLLIDGRYPHKAARMRDRQGVDWAVDSWKTPNGGQPEVFLLARWYKSRNSANQYQQKAAFAEI